MTHKVLRLGLSLGLVAAGTTLVAADCATGIAWALVLFGAALAFALHLRPPSLGDPPHGRNPDRSAPSRRPP